MIANTLTSCWLQHRRTCAGSAFMNSLDSGGGLLAVHSRQEAALMIRIMREVWRRSTEAHERTTTRFWCAVRGAIGGAITIRHAVGFGVLDTSKYEALSKCDELTVALGAMMFLDGLFLLTRLNVRVNYQGCETNLRARARLIYATRPPHTVFLSPVSRLTEKPGNVKGLSHVSLLM